MRRTVLFTWWMEVHVLKAFAYIFANRESTCHFTTGDAARQNQALFAKLRSEVELSLQAYPQKVENEFSTESVS